MSRDRDVPPAGADGESELAVWLAGAAARARFDAAAQTAEEQERWRQITSPRRREEWEVSRALLAHARTWLGAQAPAWSPDPAAQTSDAGSERAAAGDSDLTRPRVERAAALSLSHSGGYAAVAASRSAVRVGVDVECSLRPRDVMRLARFAFSEREVAQLEALPADTRDERFYILWTLKEAFAKALPLPLLASLSGCTFVEEHGEWSGSVPGAAAWLAHVFRASPTLVLSAVAVVPECDSPGNFRVSTSEWPDAAVQSWRTLATLSSRRV